MDEGFKKIGYTMYCNGVKLTREAGGRRSFAAIKERIEAHGGICNNDTEQNPQLHYLLWLDAGDLVDLLEDAYNRINDLELQNNAGALKSLGEAVVSVGITVGDKEFTLDVPYEILGRVKSK